MFSFNGIRNPFLIPPHSELAMSQLSLSPSVITYFQHVKSEFEKCLRYLQASRTLTASNTLQAYVREPRTGYIIALHAPQPWDDGLVRGVIASHDGEVLLNEAQFESSPLSDAQVSDRGRRYAAVFQAYPHVNVVIHVHTAYLGGWAGAHRPLPLLYAASQRLTLARELPVYIDRTQPESAFISDCIRANPETPGLLEANGGATFWGAGLSHLAQLILLVEEGAYFQTIAEQLGGLKDFGPGVLEQQWKMTGLWLQAKKDARYATQSPLRA